MEYIKVIVFSDSHGRTDEMCRVLEREREAAMFIHLGDCTRDAQFVSSMFPTLPARIVSGNNDYNSTDPQEIVFDLCGKKIMLAHGHQYGVKLSCNKIAAKAKSLRVDLVLFGHTHMAYYNYADGIQLLNPGSVSGAYVLRRTYASVDISESGILCTLLKV
ncbi:MAG: YfcE family phosphodiesterase [Bacillota bacterium]|nr:YfcE family phosphodiesterase [Bacillota bacterium]